MRKRGALIADSNQEPRSRGRSPGLARGRTGLSGARHTADAISQLREQRDKRQRAGRPSVGTTSRLGPLEFGSIAAFVGLMYLTGALRHTSHNGTHYFDWALVVFGAPCP